MQSLEKAHEPKDLDMSMAGRGVWLVKVPKYVSDRWKKASGNDDVGKLKINKTGLPGSKPEVIFTLKEELAQLQSDVSESSPKDHKFILTSMASQNLVVLSETPTTPTPSGVEPIYDRVSLEGKVIQRAECRPIASEKYMQLKRAQLISSNRPTRQVQQLERAVQNYKPVAVHAFAKEFEKKKKEQGKIARLEADQVKEMLFAAFEKHQYYNIKDLRAKTQQPMAHLKAILEEICVYNMKAPHRNMWELKPEYRHYKQPENEGSD
ncbi:general transcription factor IIF subunit 2-like [Liolophura sinensis]|uniref:general transcription factor IIF subunit 2-like n=1 Tax=Liolophura sinensis TaxID=3198878 RepID=UPI003158E2B5